MSSLSALTLGRLSPSSGGLRIVEGNFISSIITQESITELLLDEVVSEENTASEVSGDMIEVITNLIRTDING